MNPNEACALALRAAAGQGASILHTYPWTLLDRWCCLHDQWFWGVVSVIARFVSYGCLRCGCCCSGDAPQPGKPVRCAVSRQQQGNMRCGEHTPSTLQLTVQNILLLLLLLLPCSALLYGSMT